MAFDFPSSPSNGQIYTSGGTSYVWNGTGWTASQPFDSSLYVKKAGDTMTGDLIMAYAGSSITLNKTVATTYAQILSQSIGKYRWTMHLGDPENASTFVGSNFNLFRADDAGNFISPPALAINRATGKADFSSVVTVGNFASALDTPRQDQMMSQGWMVAPGYAHNAYVSLNPSATWRMLTTGYTSRLWLNGNTSIWDISTVSANAGALTPSTFQSLVMYSTGMLNLITAAGYTAEFQLKFPATPYGAIISSAKGNTYRWKMYLGDGANEAGSNAGSDFVLQYYDDNGNALGTSFKVTRANGITTFTPSVIFSSNVYFRNTAYAGAWYSTPGIQDRFFAGTEGGGADMWRVYTGASGNLFEIEGGGTVRARYNLRCQSFNVEVSGIGCIGPWSQTVNSYDGWAGVCYNTYGGGSSHGWYFRVANPGCAAIGVLRNDGAQWTHMLYGNGNLNSVGTVTGGNGRLWGASDFSTPWWSGNCYYYATWNGYQNLASGLILQWGYHGGGEGWVYFPAVFPSYCWAVVVVPYSGSHGALGGDNALAYTVYTRQTNAFYLQPRFCNNGGGVGVAIQGAFWMAFGH